MSDLIRIGGLWVNEAKDGKKYMAGGFGYGGRLLVFKNDNKNGDSDPDYVVYVGAKAERQDDKNEADNIPF